MGTQIVAASSFTDKAQAIAAGAQGYVTKPADPEELLAEIRRLLAQKPKNATGTLFNVGNVSSRVTSIL